LSLILLVVKQSILLPGRGVGLLGLGKQVLAWALGFTCMYSLTMLHPLCFFAEAELPGIDLRAVVHRPRICLMV